MYSSAQVDVKAALAYRDFMVSDYSDAGQARWLAGNGIDLIRGTGRLAGLHAETERVAAMSAGGRAVVELLARLDQGPATREGDRCKRLTVPRSSRPGRR